MHPTIQYQLAQTMASDRLAAADRRSRSTLAAPHRDRPARRDLYRLTSPYRRLARRMARPAGLSTGR
jgi:hypothetical protein